MLKAEDIKQELLKVLAEGEGALSEQMALSKARDAARERTEDATNKANSLLGTYKYYATDYADLGELSNRVNQLWQRRSW